MEIAIRNLVIFTIIMLGVAQIFNMVIKRKEEQQSIDNNTVEKQLHDKTLEEIKTLKDKDQALMVAAQQLNYILVNQMVKKGADVNAQDPQTHNSVLMEVVKKSCHQPQNQEALCNQGLRIARLLIDTGAKVELSNRENKTALFYAIQTANQPMIDLLVKISAGDLNGVMDMAIINQDLTMIKELLKLGVSINSLDKNNQETPLIRTAKYTSAQAYEIILFLIKHGADVFAKDLNGNNPLMLVASRVPQIELFAQQEEVFKHILSKYTIKQLQEYNQAGETILHIAVKANSINLNSRFKMIDLLLKQGLDINIINPKTLATPLLTAAYHSPNAMIDFLLNHRADINHINQKGESILSIITQQGTLDLVTQLCNRSDLKIQSGAINPLYQAIIAEKTYTALSLLDCNIDYYWHDIEKNSLLHIAAASMDINMNLIIPHLLDKGLNINQANQKGITPLMLAKTPSMFNSLLTAGADISAQDQQGNTVLHWAALHNQAEIIHLLIKKGLSIHKQNHQGGIALHLAVSTQTSVLSKRIIEQQFKTINILLEAGSNINAQDNNQDTPLTLAIAYAPKQVIAFLIEQGANINHKNKQAKTAVLIAEEHENFAVKQYLCHQTHLILKENCQ